MAKKPEKKTSQPDPGPVFVYGLDSSGKARGARFPQLRDDIIKAAIELNCFFVTNAPPAFAGIGAKLPVGRIYSSGKAFVPNVRRDLYDRLVEAGRDIAKRGVIENDSNGAVKEKDHKKPTQNASAQPASPVAYTLPPNWKGIDTGHLVIALDNPSDGYWPAVVLSRDQDVLTMKWRDYPKQQSFIRHVHDVALLQPGLAN